MADFSVDTTIHGGSPISADVTSELRGLDDMRLTLGGATATSSTIALEPVRTTASVDSRTSVDLQPVAVDTCTRLELAPLPATEVCTPYQQRWSWSVLGVELFAIDVSGRSSTHVTPVHAGPVVIDL